MKIKTCFKCGEEKKLSAFYKHPRMHDGHLNKCKECTKNDVTEHRDNNLERIRAYDRKRGSRMTPKHQRAYRKRNPEKYKATNMVNYHLRSGNMTVQNCEVCGTDKNIHAHHDDYSKPLNVRWLCAAHHRQHHTGRTI